MSASSTHPSGPQGILGTLNPLPHPSYSLKTLLLCLSGCKQEQNGVMSDKGEPQRCTSTAIASVLLSVSTIPFNWNLLECSPWNRTTHPNDVCQLIASQASLEQPNISQACVRDGKSSLYGQSTWGTEGFQGTQPRNYVIVWGTEVRYSDSLAYAGRQAVPTLLFINA